MTDRLDIVSFVFGLVFLGAAAAYVTDEYLSVDLDTRWVWPVLLMVAGVAVLAGTLRRVTANGDDAGDETANPGF